MKFLKIPNPKAELGQKAHREQWASGGFSGDGLYEFMRHCGSPTAGAEGQEETSQELVNPASLHQLEEPVLPLSSGSS